MDNFDYRSGHDPPILNLTTKVTDLEGHHTKETSMDNMDNLGYWFWWSPHKRDIYGQLRLLILVVTTQKRHLWTTKVTDFGGHHTKETFMDN